MTVSKDTIERMVKLMLNNDKEYTIEALRRLSGYSQPTIRQAISGAILQGTVYKVAGSYPAKFRAIVNPPERGQVIVIKEPIPALELNESTQAIIRKVLNKRTEELNPQHVVHHLALYYMDADVAKRINLKELLVNFAEIIKQDLENNKELDPADIKVS